MTKAQEFSIKVQSEDPEKKEKPEGEQPSAPAASKPSKVKKDGEELVRLLQRSIANTY
jgi:26S proteasome regulatory subunit N1